MYSTLAATPDLHASDAWQHHFPGVELLAVAAALLDPLPAWDGREGPRGRVTVGPGVIRVGYHDPARAERSAGRAAERRRRRLDMAARVAVQDRGDLGENLRELMDGPGRGAIIGWSARSRSRMVETLASLDYSPLLAGGVPAMVTFTLPEEWAWVVPSSRDWKRAIRLFLLRFRRAWGRPLVGVWKSEYQRRGAPHLHVLMCPPRGVDSVTGRPWGRWFAETWADVLGVGGDTWRRVVAVHSHWRAHSDYAEGLRASDPRRMAVYFSKHGSYAAKARQDQPPAEWVEQGSTGRVWGVWGLARAVVVVEVHGDQAEAIGRALSGWASVQRWRDKQGRRVPAPRRMLGLGAAGFVCVNDGPSTLAAVVRYLDLRAAVLRA